MINGLRGGRIEFLRPVGAGAASQSNLQCVGRIATVIDCIVDHDKARKMGSSVACERAVQLVFFRDRRLPRFRQDGDLLAEQMDRRALLPLTVDELVAPNRNQRTQKVVTAVKMRKS